MEPPAHITEMIKARAKALGPISLRDQMWREAVQFHESAQRNFEQRVGPDGRYAFPFTAGVVGLAFASELYLKTLLLIAHGKAPSGHRLNVLFAKLPDTVRDLVKVRYEQRRKGTGSVLERDLVTYSNAFVEFRYVYEGGNRAMDVVGLGQIAASLYEASLRLNPDLQMYEYTHIRVTSALQGVPIFSQGAHPYPPGPPWPDEEGASTVDA
ncbi:MULTISPECIES: hypothetical protein [unclassified Brevundimonas]|uniref:hypothetical protein n=1 Tax=unclassified Brevundimonas TaxID=2622653 RepID=UPI000701D564|nr:MULTISPECIES: hypothetical protein [unclassified Brevundimonas]